MSTQQFLKKYFLTAWIRFSRLRIGLLAGFVTMVIYIWLA
jgi:hypothetical protein